ncbi:MAG: phage tail protein [Anaerolineae bacterium]|nr:phage tail protein [Anaerolineae bacterium]
MYSPDLERHIDKYYGKYSGVVTDNADPQNRGAVQVLVPSVLGEELKVWARPCLPYGHFFVPPVDAKVWVEFEAGNPSYPLWVGVWYATGTVPTQAAISPPDNRVIQTTSGHTIEIMDKSGEEKIVIKHKSNAFVSIDKEGSVLLSNKQGSSVILNAKDKNVMVVEENGNTISMKDDSIVLMNKGGEATIEMKGGVVQIAGTKIILRGGQVVLGEGALEPTIMGNMFTTMFMAHTHPTAVGPSGPPIPPLVPQTGPHLTKAVVVK